MMHKGGHPTTTGFVGELANFSIGCALILPAGLLYQIKRTKKGAVMGMAVGTVVMAAASAVLNAYGLKQSLRQGQLLIQLSPVSGPLS